MITSMILISAMFMTMKHPLSMGMMLLMQTIMIALMTGMMNMTFWFSYIIFIIMIGGMLILFMYMTSVASNEKFKFSNKILVMSIIIMILSLMIWMKDFQQIYQLMDMEESYQATISNNFNHALNKYMNYPNNLIMYTMFFYLFITMIMVTKITKIESGPLRQKN
uniref:NADH-ubiquinone oxidoreductase chain 6 n=1 Tax=Crioceris asparagi TaxID=131627 RepID=A0A1P8NN94_CRIAP|nr:NADH dehydrogenase subunit 6 [Crioceris asparagi]